MQLVLLSGGSGQRLWPLSNEARSKQFLRLLKNNEGVLESMAQRIYNQLKKSSLEKNVLISTNAKQKDAFLGQIGENISILTEPERRDTFAAIVLACSYLFTKKKCTIEEPIVVLPCDQFVDDSYFSTIIQIAQEIERGEADMVLMGIKPTSPSTKYGYIIPERSSNQYSLTVKHFKEKPDIKSAKEYISQNAYWNGGVFGFKLGYLLNLISKYIADISFESIYTNFGKLPKISFDYEVVEKAKNVKFIPYSGKWEDLGTWESLLSEIQSSIIGKGKMMDDCEDAQIINELNIPVLCSGVSNLAIVASYDGILVTSKSNSTNIKPAVEQLSTRPFYEEREWGAYKTIDYNSFDSGIMQFTKQLLINPGKSTKYHACIHSDKVWTIVDGIGEFVLDGNVLLVKMGDVLNIKAGQKHAIKAIRSLTIIEVQFDSNLVEEDIEYFNWNWE